MDYKSSYLYLFNKLTEITKEIEEIQKQAEEICIDQEEKISIVEIPNND